MQFTSLSDFLNMGGYSFFVWLSFGGTFLAMFGLLWHSRWVSNNIKKKAINNEKRQNRIRQGNHHREDYNDGRNMNEATK